MRCDLGHRGGLQKVLQRQAINAGFLWPFMFGLLQPDTLFKELLAQSDLFRLRLINETQRCSDLRFKVTLFLNTFFFYYRAF